MIQTQRSTRGMAVAPHALASQSALAVLRDGGNAIEAMVAAAATISVVYPHMNGIGGDAFWLIVPPGNVEPIAIDAAGPAASRATQAFYTEQGFSEIPMRGPLSMNTIAGAIGSWDVALKVSQQRGGAMPLKRLLVDAINYAADGMPITASQAAATQAKFGELAHLPGFAERFLAEGKVPTTGMRFRQPRLAEFMTHLAEEGLDSFYRGAIAEMLAQDLAAVGSPISLADLNNFSARACTPLQLDLGVGRVFNMVPPTQGTVSLAILGLLERTGIRDVAPDSADYVHLCVEATKQAFLELRDRYLTDPMYMNVDAQSLLASSQLDALAANIDPNRALPWGGDSKTGDTIWMGVIDSDGLAVSFIQSVYHEFGSGIVLPQSGINWQNRGASFSLDPKHLLALQPGKKPFHTLNPAAARLADGRTMVYGTMGGDGQPQTQAAVFSRAIWFGQPLQQAVSSPRWLLGRTWGQPSVSLKLESRFSPALVADLRKRGHDVELLDDWDETVGHAGAIVRSPDGILEGAADPRSDGGVAAW
ncbi:MAG TPA: gamma-glutamyltransferase family protein [Rhodocyclaceae bacterium]|nr:gamma-glutamyltransferase family protein [Rhodocyclaceae bacterium]